MVGHDIGLMWPTPTPHNSRGDERLVLMDAFLPGIGDWRSVWLMRDLWDFHFYGEVR